MLARTVVAPPGVSDARVAILREALARVVNDREFLADAYKLILDVDFRSGAKVQRLVADILASPKRRRRTNWNPRRLLLSKYRRHQKVGQPARPRPGPPQRDYTPDRATSIFRDPRLLLIARR